MTEFIVKVEDNKKKLVEDLLKELGCEIINSEKKTNDKIITTKDSIRREKKSNAKLTPFSIFSKWKDIDLDPETFRKKLWERNQKF